MGGNVLLFMPSMFDLPCQMQRALSFLGFNVDFIEDVHEPFSPLYRSARFKYLKSLYFKCFNPNKRRLKKKGVFTSYKVYDYFLCIDGFSFDKSLIDHLKAINPKIKTILYLYDSVNVFDFTSYFNLFDKVYTFDYVDSERYKLNLLPLFWRIDGDFQDNLPSSYDLFFVGSIHSDRFQILNQINSEAKRKGMTTYIKLYVNPRSVLSTFFQLKYRFLSMVSKKYKEQYQIYYLIGKNKINSDIITFHPISKDELDEKMALSSCIIDIELPCQSGLSHRFIQALAMHKKILTTNEYVEKTEFYNETMISFLDRKNPSVPGDFLKTNRSPVDAIEKFRIDNWLKILLGIS